ncbi:hypothetical protein KQX54_004140 [Cotesia glomerata]|uniref:Uncharacterized protein n=1 Tax=Cotesia glomerata TaxID=32391 RepID=A0AAV7J171_COTGL|nr:hypothetical protein KQX54_004140 [Cotesia glomerata]
MGANVKRKSKSGMTPLMAAAEQSNVKILSFILEQKPNVNDVDASGNTALHYVFHYLNKENRSRYSFTHTSAARTDDDRIILLHKAGADLNAKCSFKNHPDLTTILDLAVYLGSIAAVNYLLYSTPVGLKQLDYSKIELAAFDENALEAYERTSTEYVELLKEQSSKVQFNLALFILNRHEIGIQATEDTLQKVHDFVKKEEEENSRFFGYYREVEQFRIESRQFLEDKKLGLNGISYWKIITENREDLVKLLFNDDFRSQTVIEGAGRNKKVIEEVNNLFSAVLPFDCCEHIVYLMTNDELKNFIKSLNPPDISDFNF